MGTKKIDGNLNVTGEVQVNGSALVSGTKLYHHEISFQPHTINAGSDVDDASLPLYIISTYSEPYTTTYISQHPLQIGFLQGGMISAGLDGYYTVYTVTVNINNNEVELNVNTGSLAQHISYEDITDFVDVVTPL